MVAAQEVNKTTHPQIKIDGAELTPEYMSALEEWVVDRNLHLPAMLTMRFHVAKPEWLNDNKLIEGKEVELAAMERTTPQKLFTGKIMSVELNQDEQMPALTVRAYDHSFGLHRFRQNRSFINVTDSDLVNRLAGEVGLSGQADSASQVYEYIYQYDQSNYEFLRERARRIGYDLYVDDKKLCFKRPHQTTGAETNLTWGQTLKRFHARTSLAEPVNSVEVRGWDPKAKREIVGTASTSNGLPEVGAHPNGAALAQRTWSTQTKFVVTDEWVASQADANGLAQSYIDELGGAYIEADCHADGAPAILPGRKVKLDGLGTRFDGKYYVTAARHEYSTKDGLQTHFTVSSRRAQTISEMLEDTRPRQAIDGPIIGIVTNINDPDKLGRVKVKFPTLGASEESHWARIATPLTGAERGAHFLPEVNDEVLVAFVHGDINHPYIIGGLWNGMDKPPVPPALPNGRDSEILIGGGSKVKNRLIKSTKGNMLIFNDSDDAPGVFLVGKSGAYIMVDDVNGKELIALADKTKGDFIEIRSQDQSIWIEAVGPITIKNRGNIKVETQGNLDATVQGNLTAKTTGNTNVEATGSTTVKGMAVTVEATAALTLKGATVAVQGSGPVTIKGATVMIN